MSETVERHEMTKKTVLYEMPGTDAVTIRQDVEYHAADAGALAMDIYYPAGADPPLPAV